MIEPVAETDFIVIGSGAAGLTAALTAGASGASVVVLEKSDKIGGTSAWSGGLLWTPVNPKHTSSGAQDDEASVVEYICRIMNGEAERAVVESFVRHAPETIRFIERASPLRLDNCPYPDTFAEASGGVAAGRHLEPAPFSINKLGAWRESLRQPLAFNPFTTRDVLRKRALADLRGMIRRNLPLILWRSLGRRRVGGVALVAGLLAGCVDHGCELRLLARAVQLKQASDGAVVGVVAQTSGGMHQLKARRAVILANGGFEWNAERVARHLPLSLPLLPTPPNLSNGDNLLLAEQVGAELSRMDTYWHWPVGNPPGLTSEGHAVGALSFAERTLPHSLWINRHGRRFVNEASHNCALAFEQRDAAGQLLNQPAWVLFDAQYRSKYPIFFRVMPGGADPDWLTKADSLAELAVKVGIDARNLQQTVARFNALAKQGCDDDFGRGSHIYERALGDTKAQHPNLGTLAQPPYYLASVIASAVGTRGGPRTNAYGQVLRPGGDAIRGFYAAGNAAACFYGRNMIAGGGTLMPAMTFARLAVLHALERS